MLEELKEQYRQSLPGKIHSIRALLSDFREGKADALAKIRLLAHSLHGSGTTLGYPQISAAAKKIEHASPDTILQLLSQLVHVLLEAAREPAAAHVHILVIEDDHDISTLLKVLLTQKSEQYRVTVAASVTEAGTVLKQHPFALVVLDLVLPDGDGRGLLREIRATIPATSPVFVLSGIDRKSIMDECLARGAQRYFSKPFNPGNIAAMIHEELSSPSTAETKTGAEAGIPATATGTGGRILVAEDD